MMKSPKEECNTMSIEELALILDEEIEIRFPDINQNYMFSFKNAEIKEGSMLVSTCGRGKTSDVAKKNYMPEIAGKILVFHAFDKERRREIVVPLTIC
jgi:hypothetical protein